MNSEFQTPTFYRQFVDVSPLFAAAMKSWYKQGMLAKVRVEQITLEALPRLWIHPESVLSIATRFVLEAIEASIPGSLIEVELRPADESHEWITLSVRDWAGGKPDGWAIDSSTQRLVKQLEGYIDVANHPGRGAVCSLHLPSGNLQGWLCRQPHSALGYYVSWNPNSLGISASKNALAKIDEAIQLSLQFCGSIVPVGECAYLLASSSTVDEISLKSSIAKRLQIGHGSQKLVDTLEVRIDYLGLMGEFMRRLESSIPTSTIDFVTEIESSTAPSIIRVDPQHQHRAKESELTKRSISEKASTTRMRPRRVVNH